ncbi:MAG: TonB-dependent receptor [Kiritimatiellae bacterium]|nr:TonB-dependent receptor [Kiritimatiellia bacterium]
MRKEMTRGMLFFVLAVTALAGDEVFTLGDLVIRDAGGMEEQAPSVSVVTEQDIRDVGAQTVDQALRLIPGVTLQSAGKNAREISIRGFSPSSLKVLVDGIPANETYFRSIDLSQIPAAAVSEIIVIRGLPSVLYGANSMGGVVNIVTKKGGDRPGASAEVQVADYSTMHAALSGGFQHSNINVQLTYAYQTSDGFPCSSDLDADDPYVGVRSKYHEDGGLRENSDYRKKALTGKIGYDTEDSKLYLSFDWHDNVMSIPVEYNRSWRFTEWKQGQLNLVGEQQMGPVNVKARGYYFMHDDQLEDDVEKTVSYGGKSWFDQSAYEDYSVGGLVQADWQMTENNILRGGVNAQFEQNRQRELNTKNFAGQVIRPGWSEDSVYETETWDFALEDEWTLDRLVTVLGMSYDVYRPLRSAEVTPGDDIGSFNPQLVGRYTFSDDVQAFAGVGRKTRFPHMKELYSQHAGGNPDLDPEYTDTVDLGAEVRPFAGHSTLRLTADVFYNDIKDLIESVDISADASQYQNVGHATSKGIELGAEYAPVPEVLLGAAYTWLDAWNEDTDQRLQYQPRNQLSGSFKWMPGWGITVLAQARYADDAVEYLTDKKTGEYTHHLPDYVVCDAGVEKVCFEYFTVSVRAENLLDENYDIGGGPMPGRILWAGLRAEW